MHIQSYKMRFIKIALSIIVFLLMFASCHQNKNFPIPTDDTVIHENGEDGDSYAARMRWIDLMHGGENSNWKEIEAQNQETLYQEWLKMTPSNRSNDEYVADGLLLGRWVEGGSVNNAGNIMAVDFDPETEEVYAVGGGGPMFKSDISGTEWTLVNDKLRFSTDLIKVFNLQNNTKRIISAINGIPHYSDDSGKVWIKSTGVTPTNDGHIYHSQSTKDGIVFFLGKKDYWSNIRVYASFDFGLTYTALKTFTTSDTRNIAMTLDGVSDQIYVIEQIATNQSNLFKFNKSNKQLGLHIANTPIGFGAEGRANLQVATVKDSVYMYLYNNENRFYVSKNGGNSWTSNITLPASPWDMGLYVCPSDPEKMFFGEVDAFRSLNGGFGWQRVNHWWEYYGDIYTQLHADMMTMKEFRDKSGKPFILNGNHGGLYYSDDYGKTHSNIGIIGLNVSQYYDVRTFPADPYYVFAGSQDQGQQRGFLTNEGPSELEQNISGDYGHIEFTGNGKSLWSVYPGGSIGFYSNPKTQSGPIAGYEINSKNETVWIPPIMPGPDPSKNIVIAAGGSVNPNSTGSHLIQLEYTGNEIKATELPYNFASSGGQISAMAIDHFDPNKWYVATTNGQFYRSTNGGQNFSRTASMLSESHYLYGSCILPSKVKENVIYLSGNGYNFKPVYRSTNGGQTFQSFSTGLPSTMVFNIVANDDESLLFAATEAGPYVYIAAKERWYSLHGQFTPNQTYWSVEYVSAINTARFGTYGRGLWDFEVKEIVTNTDQLSFSKSEISVFPIPAKNQIFIECHQEKDLILPVTIKDAQGRTVLVTNSVKNAPIDISMLSPGVYYIVIFKNRKALSKKFVKI